MAIATETNYRKKQILIGFMSDLVGNTLSKAIDISAYAETVELTSNVALKDTTRSNNNGQQSGSITGKASYEGTITLDNPRPISAMLFAAILGKSSTFSFGPLSASAWASETAVEKGDIVTISGGFLVAQNDGTTGTVEPAITTEVDYDDLAVDGDVVWKLRTSLYSGADYETGFCTDQMIIIERAGEGCGSSNSFDRIVEGAEFTYYSMGQTDGEIVASQAIPIMARRERRSTEPDWEDITITTTIVPREDYWTNSTCIIRVDDQPYGTLLNFQLTYTRNTTIKDVVGEYNEKTISVDTPTFDGSVSIKLDPTEYEYLRTPKYKKVTLAMTGFDGETLDITIPTCQFHSPTIDAEGSRELWMSATLKPVGSPTQAMANAQITTAINAG